MHACPGTGLGTCFGAARAARSREVTGSSRQQLTPRSPPAGRCYPGGIFDPLSLATGDDERAFKLKTAEIKHGRLAMVAFLGAPRLAPAQLEGAPPPAAAAARDAQCRAFAQRRACADALGYCPRAACAGYGVQALSTGEGALGSLAKFADNL
jgi:hypothetical protein